MREIAIKGSQLDQLRHTLPMLPLTIPWASWCLFQDWVHSGLEPQFVRDFSVLSKVSCSNGTYPWIDRRGWKRAVLWGKATSKVAVLWGKSLSVKKSKDLGPKWGLGNRVFSEVKVELFLRSKVVIVFEYGSGFRSNPGWRTSMYKQRKRKWKRRIRVRLGGGAI